MSTLREVILREAMKRGRKAPRLSRKRAIGKLAGMKLVRDRIEGVPVPKPEPNLNLPVFKRLMKHKEGPVEIPLDDVPSNDALPVNLDSLDGVVTGEVDEHHSPRDPPLPVDAFCTQPIQVSVQAAD